MLQDYKLGLRMLLKYPGLTIAGGLALAMAIGIGAGWYDLVVIGSKVKIGETPATVVGVMPDGFKYPFNYHAWTPLQLRASYNPLEGGAMSVIGRLASGISREQADAEVRALSERMATKRVATHEHLRSRVTWLDEPGDLGDPDVSDLAQFAITNLPVLLVLMIACMNVGTLVYARTATREGEIAVRTALGATRARIVGQLFVETLVLVSLAAVIGLTAADRTLRWGMGGAYTDEGGLPFWITPGLSAATMVYAVGIAMTGAAMLSLLPALRVTRARVHTHLANLGSGGGTLRFGRLWTGAMIAQVTLTAIGIPVAMESASRVARADDIYAKFPSRDYVAARIAMDLPFDEAARSSFEERRGRTLAEIERRVAQEPGVMRDRSSSTRRSCAGSSNVVDAGRQSVRVFDTSSERTQQRPPSLKLRWTGSQPLKRWRAHGSRSSASFETSVWIRMTRARRRRRSFMQRLWEECRRP